MQSFGPPVAAPDSVEEAVLSAMAGLGRRLRLLSAGDAADFSCLPLLKIVAYDGPLRLSELAERLGLDASTVSRQARQLEERGLLHRTEDPEDRRASQVRLSEAGGACLESGGRARRRLVADVLKDWNMQDRERLRVLLTRFHDDLATTDGQEST